MMASKKTSGCNNTTTEEEELINNEFIKDGIVGVQNYTRAKLNKWRSTPLHIAVTGETGAGKSTFINVIRELKTGEKGAADTDVVECTSTIKPYLHPENKNVIFWDLPGIGTENFKRENYEDKVELAKYDFCLIFSSVRFTENDGWLATKISKMGKKFYFVRTKVFADISNEEHSREVKRSKDEILNKIRSDCLQNLKRHKISDCPVYLIDNFVKDDFDFNRLQLKMIEDTPQMKRDVMVFSIVGQAQEILFQKKKELEKRVQAISLLSAVTSAIPLPGLNTAVDFAIMVTEIKLYTKQFGLTEDAIRKSACLLGVREEELKKELEMEDLIMNLTVKGLTAVCQGIVISEGLEEVTKYLLPILGSIVAGVISYKSTNYWLKKILEGLYKDALKINEKLCILAAKSSSV